MSEQWESGSAVHLSLGQLGLGVDAALMRLGSATITDSAVLWDGGDVDGGYARLVGIHDRRVATVVCRRGAGATVVPTWP